MLERRSTLGQLECAGETEQPSTEGLLYLWVKAEQTHIRTNSQHARESVLGRGRARENQSDELAKHDSGQRD